MHCSLHSQPSIKSSIDGAEETEGYNEQEHLTEDLPIGRNVHVAMFTKLIISLSISVHAAAATENEQVRAALTLPHPRLWQEFQRLAAALSTNEVHNIGVLFQLQAFSY